MSTAEPKLMLRDLCKTNINFLSNHQNQGGAEYSVTFRRGGMYGSPQGGMDSVVVMVHSLDVNSDFQGTLDI
jgi:hypothetical protein